MIEITSDALIKSELNSAMHYLTESPPQIAEAYDAIWRATKVLDRHCVVAQAKLVQQAEVLKAIRETRKDSAEQ